MYLFSVVSVYRLLSKECAFLSLLGDKLPYEVTVGLNGRVWVKGRSVEETVIIINLLKNSETIPDSMMSKYVNRALNKLVGVK